jgi:hypothetical protein
MRAPDDATGRLARAFEALSLLKTNPRQVPPEAVEGTLRVLPSHYHQRETAVEVQGLRGAPDWLGYEVRLWELSEVVRQYLKANRRLRGGCGVLDAVVDIVSDARFGKGRQNFVLVLAQYGGQRYAKVIGDLLEDPDIFGHAVRALAKLRAPGYSARIKAILRDSKVAWIRRGARNYLQAVGDPP